MAEPKTQQYNDPKHTQTGFEINIVCLYNHSVLKKKITVQKQEIKHSNLILWPAPNFQVTASAMT